MDVWGVFQRASIPSAVRMYHGATIAELSEHCAFRCQQSKEMIITESEEDTFIVTHPSAGLNIKCANHVENIGNELGTRPGALELFVPCECTLRVNESVVVPNRYTCGLQKKQLSVVHILPTSWTNIASLSMNPLQYRESQLIFGNYSEILDHQWNLKVPHLNVTSSASLSKIVGDVRVTLARTEAYGEAAVSSYHGDLIYVVWNSALSLAVVYVILKINGFAGALAYMRTARADTVFTEVKVPGVFKDDLYICIIILLSLFLVFLMAMLVWEWVLRCRATSHQGRQQGVNPGSVRHGLTAQQGILQFANGNSVVVEMIQAAEPGRIWTTWGGSSGGGGQWRLGYYGVKLSLNDKYLLLC